MLQWKSKVGYYTKTYSGYPPSSIPIEDFVFLDESYFTLYNYFPIYTEWQYLDTQKPAEAYRFFKGLFGNQLDNVFVQMSHYKNDIYNPAGVYMTQTLPSMVNNFLNTYKYIQENSDFVMVTYIPSLKVAFVDNTFYQEKSPGVFSATNRPYSAFSYYDTEYDSNRGSRVSLVSYGGDVTYESLTNPNNYIRATMDWATYAGGDVSAIGAVSTVAKEAYEAFFWNFAEPDVPPNPYEPGGPSGPTDPTIPPGTFDNTSDAIPDSSLPTISAANTGFTRIYNPNLTQVQGLAQYLWTTPDVIETIWNHIKQFFENPMDAIIGFNLVPVPVPDGGIETFKLMFVDTGLAMTVAANQFVDVDCGTLQVQRYYGSALDQSPFTKISCFLPFIGTVNLNTDEVMGATLQCKYRVDIVSGSCVAKILVDGNCIYQFSGHCAITIPFSSADFSSYVSAAISVGKLAAAALTAGASAAAAAGVEEVAQQTNQVVTTTDIATTARNPATGRQITTGTTRMVETRESPADQSSTQASFSGLSPQNVANTVGQIMSSKPYIEHSGSFSGNSGYLGVRRPFLIIERPNMCMPENYQSLNGFPSMITLELSTCKGFTRVQQVQLTGLGATNPEQAEIMEFLKNGVIL